MDNDIGDMNQIRFGKERGKKAMATKQNSNDISLVAETISDYIDLKIGERRFSNGRSTFAKKNQYFKNDSGFEEWTKKLAEDGYLVMYYWGSSGILHKDDNYIEFNRDSNLTGITFFGDYEWIETAEKEIENYMEKCMFHMKWVYNIDGSSTTIPIKHDKLPVSEMYPFLKGKSLEEYYDDYINSDANTLLLIGPPGTGKTSFIKGMLSHVEESATVSYNAQVLNNDGFFVDFIRSSTKFLIMEDCDAFLSSRSDGNDMMHKFLNLSDGLVTVKGKKMIFSTNLPSIRDVDEALLRPGRCFDVINFDKLNADEATILATKYGITLKKEKEFYTIAEVFNQDSHQIESTGQEKLKMGFI
jgi:hypothetical protein